ncbi:DUF4168 domain-containing protein [Malaciobacter canalis]|uniref:DUF4168 domain-containing protein n=1 Tax=Malaciobacter canalis TaxID=1912871 RepID=UPI00384D0834
MLKIIFSVIAFCAILSANQPTQVQNAQVSKEEVKSFANASKQINTLKVSIQEKMDGMYNKSQKPLSNKEVEKFNQDFMNKAKVVIQNNNLTIKKYNLLTQLFKTDDNFKARVQKHLLEK